MRGRKPNPNARRDHKKKDSRKRVTATGSPSCPGWLGADASEAWERAMSVAPWLASADEFKLAGFCQAIADLRWSVQKIAADGYTIEANQGLIPHPANGIKNKALTVIAKLGSDLGFDPATRQRLMAPPEKEDEGAEFFDGPPLRLAK